MLASRQHRSLIRNAFLGVLILCSAAEFIVRGPLRFADASSFNDFISPYIQARAWIQGQDPYSAVNLVRLWPPEAERFVFLSRDLSDGTLVYKRGIPTAYPLTAFVLIAPLAILPWHIAQPLWLVVTVLSFVVTVASLMQVAAFFPWSVRGAIFVGLTLALAPFHTALAAGSIVSVAVAASAAAVWAAERDHDVLAGLLLAAAVSLKPQIGLPFLFYYLIRRHWRIPAVAFGAVGVLSGIALARLLANGAAWLQSYIYDNRVLFANGSLGDFTEKSPLRFGLINFQVAAYALLHSRNAAIIVAFAAAAAGGIVWLFFLNRREQSRDGLLEVSALAVLSLLPVYHRLYDATLLIFPLAWSLAAWNGRLRTMARAVFAVIVIVFLVPGGILLDRLQANHFPALIDHRWWNSLVMPHESWSILLLAILLLRAMQHRVASTAADS